MVEFTYFHHDQWLWLSAKIQLGQTLLANQFHIIGKVFLEERDHVLHRVEFLELGHRHEQRNCPTAVLVGQRNHHKVAPWPNVQILGGHCRFLGVRGRNGELQVAMLDERLTVIESRCRNDLSPDSTVGTICTHYVVGCLGDGNFGLGARG